MDLLTRFCGIWMVFVISFAVGVEGADYGEICATTTDAWGDCTETTNIVCDTTCKCATGFFRLTTSAACDAQVTALNSACVIAETEPDQCAVTDSECRVDGTAKCLCKDTHYTNGAACTIKILLNQACTVSPAGQCADSLAACDGTALVCKCSSGNFEKNDGNCATQVASLEDPCVTAETASDQCAVADSECKAAECLCKDTHYKSGTTTCTIRKKPDEEGCAADQCVTHATCNTGSSPTKCECDAGYTATPTTSPTMCSGVVKFASLSYMYVVPILVSMMFLLR